MSCVELLEAELRPLTHLSHLSSRVAVVATSSSPARLSAAVSAAFVHQVVLQSPTEEQRLAMLGALSQHLHLGGDVSLETLSKNTTVTLSCRTSH